MSALTEKTVNVGNHPIHYIEVGNGAEPCLLLPGALGTAKSDFKLQLEGLNSRDQLKVIAWDPPGYGNSRPPERSWPEVPTFYHRDAQMAHQFMTTIGHQKYSIVGWSDGGITSLIMAAK